MPEVVTSEQVKNLLGGPIQAVLELLDAKDVVIVSRYLEDLGHNEVSVLPVFEHGSLQTVSQPTGFSEVTDLLGADGEPITRINSTLTALLIDSGDRPPSGGMMFAQFVNRT